MLRGMWTPDDLRFLKKQFGTHPTAEVAGDLGRPTDAVKKKASSMGHRKTKINIKKL